MNLQTLHSLVTKYPNLKKDSYPIRTKKLSELTGEWITEDELRMLWVEYVLWLKDTDSAVQKEIDNFSDIPTEEELELVDFKLTTNIPQNYQGFTPSSFKVGVDGKIREAWYRKEDEGVPPQIDWKSEFKKAVEESKKAITFPTPLYTETGKLLVINAYDVHLNKKGLYTTETLQDQVRIFEECVIDIVNKVSSTTNLEKILFIVGHDFFHNEFNGSTTKGTKLDCLESPEVLFREGFKSMIKMINMCSKFAPVDIQHVNGNHCFYGELQLLSALEVYFENAENIVIYSNQRDRQYYQFYNNGFQLIHDTKKKLSDLPLVFSLESPQIFANTKNRFILSGHLHGQQQSQFLTSNEGYGIEHIQCPSIAATDRWHEDNLYIGNKRRMLGLLIDSVYGTEQFIYSNVKYGY